MIREEKIVHTLQFNKRYEEFIQILNGTEKKEISIKPIFSVFGTIAVTYLITCYITLIPVENVIETPQYWFEQMLHLFGLYCPVLAGFVLLMCSYLMNIRYIKTLKHCFVLSLAGYICVIITFPIIYLIWTYGFKYSWPLPFVGFIFSYFIVTTQYISLWYCFPRQWRNNIMFRDRFKFFLITHIWCCLQAMLYSAWNKIFLVFPD